MSDNAHFLKLFGDSCQKGAPEDELWNAMYDDVTHIRPTIYLAGPMRGYPDFNYPLFNAVTKRLRSGSWVVHNPAETDAEVQKEAGDAEIPLRVYMRQDLADVASSDAVFVLPGWERSEGTRIETTVAAMLKIPIYRLPDFVEVTDSVFERMQYYAMGAKTL